MLIETTVLVGVKILAVLSTIAVSGVNLLHKRTPAETLILFKLGIPGYFFTVFVPLLDYFIQKFGL